MVVIRQRQREMEERKKRFALKRLNRFMRSIRTSPEIMRGFKDNKRKKRFD